MQSSVIEPPRVRQWERNGHGGKPPDNGGRGDDDGRFRRGNELPEGPWCGHPMIDLQTRRCANDNCGRELPPGAWERLRSAPFVAPPGQLWVLEIGYQDEEEKQESAWGPEPANPGSLVGIFTDRRKILHRIIRGWITDAADIRNRRIHWYQGAFNETIWDGWDEGDVKRPESYCLSLKLIDSAG